MRANRLLRVHRFQKNLVHMRLCHLYQLLVRPTRNLAAGDPVLGVALFWHDFVLEKFFIRRVLFDFGILLVASFRAKLHKLGYLFDKILVFITPLVQMLLKLVKVLLAKQHLDFVKLFLTR